jgi:hypothetical protein
MNEYAVAGALKELIDTKRKTLVSGLSLDGEDRYIAQLTASILTPPERFYFVGIDVQDGDQSYDYPNAGRNVSHASKVASAGAMMRDRYNVSIYVMDYAHKATPLENYVQSFEEEHQLFRVLTDRIVHLLDQTETMTYDSYTIYLIGDRGVEDRNIRKVNRHDAWESDDGDHFRLLTEISFRAEACSNSS